MRPVDQKFLIPNSNLIPGDCLRACVASILELEYELVPHFALFYSNWLTALKAWATVKNLEVIQVTLHNKNSQPIHELDNINYFIAVGDGPRNYTHCVVIDRELQLVHDPHPSRDGLKTMSYVIGLAKL